MFQCLPDDPRIKEMDDTTKTWIFFSWLEDKDEHSLLLRNQGCLIGSFWNPKAAEELLGIGNSHKMSVSDEEADKAFQFVVDDRLRVEAEKNAPKKR